MQEAPTVVVRESLPASFQASRAREATAAFCYPRQVGSPGEQRAADAIAHAFGDLGFTVKREAFPVYLRSATLASRCVFITCGMLVVLGWLATAWAAWAAALCFGAVVLLINSPWWSVPRGPVRASPWQTWAQNLVARPAADPPPCHARVIFMAHYDTKSQLVSTGVRVLFVMGTATLCGLLALAAVAASAGWDRAWLFSRPDEVSLLVLCFLTGLVVNGDGNRSPGALDNGSGVGVLLELARTWKSRPGRPLDVWFVATSAEETDLEGARDFLYRHDALWAEMPTLLINLESVGTGRRVYLAGQETAVGLAEAAADRLRILHARLYVLGAGMDHQPFAAAGLPSLSIMGDVVRASFFMHTPRDTMRLIQEEALARAGLLAAELAWAWGELHAAADTMMPSAASPQQPAT